MTDDELPKQSPAAAARSTIAGRFATAGMPAEKSEDFGESTKRLLRRMAPDKVGAAAVIVLAVVSVTFAVLGPKILGNATDIVFRGIFSEGGVDFPALHRTLGLVLALYVASATLAWLQSAAEMKLASRLFAHEVPATGVSDRSATPATAAA